MSDKAKEAVVSLIDFLADSGHILVKKGTTAEAADEILANAVDVGLEKLGVKLQVAEGVEIDLSLLLPVLGPAIEAALEKLVDELSPGSVRIVTGSNVDISWKVD